MLNRFMISVAALALVAGTGLANAQGTTKNENGGAGALCGVVIGNLVGRRERATALEGRA